MKCSGEHNQHYCQYKKLQASVNLNIFASWYAKFCQYKIWLTCTSDQSHFHQYLRWEVLSQQWNKTLVPPLSRAWNVGPFDNCQGLRLKPVIARWSAEQAVPSLTLRGKCTPNQNWCFVSNFSAFFPPLVKYNHLKQIVQCMRHLKMQFVIQTQCKQLSWFRLEQQLGIKLCPLKNSTTVVPERALHP